MAFDVDFEVVLTPEAAAQRLKENTEPVSSLVWSFPSRQAKSRILSRMEGQQFGLRIRHWYSNGLTSFFRGEIIGTAQGSRIRGDFYVLAGIQWLMVLLCFVFAGVGLSLTLSGNFMGTLIGVFEFLLMLIIWAVGRAFGKQDEVLMIRFLYDLFWPDRTGKG